MSTIPGRYEPWLIVGLLLLVVIVRLPTWSAPLARDAGVYAFIGQQITMGQVPYRDIWDHKPPGLYYVFALALTLFQGSTITLRACELLWASLASLALYGLARQYTRPLPAAGATALFVVAANHATFSDCGDLTFPETYMLLPTILGVGACQHYVSHGQKGRLAVAGALGGLAFLFKPPALMWVGTVGLYLAAHDWRTRRHLRSALLPPLVLAAGLSTMVGTVLLYFSTAGALPDLVSQVFTYNSLYVRGYLGWHTARALERGLVPVLLATPGLWILGMMGLTGRACEGLGSPARPSPLLIAWALADLLAPFSGGKLIPHYFLQCLPALAVLSACTLDRVHTASCRRSTGVFATCVLVLGISVSTIQHIYASTSIAARCPFRWLPEQAAAFVRQRTAPDEPIYVWGTGTGIHFLAQRPSPTRYVYLYPLQSYAYSTDAQEATLLADLRAHPPAYIVDTSTTNGRIPRLDGSAPGAGSEPMYERAEFPLIAAFARRYYAPAAAVGPWIIHEYQAP